MKVFKKLLPLLLIAILILVFYNPFKVLFHNLTSDEDNQISYTNFKNNDNQIEGSGISEGIFTSKVKTSHPFEYLEETYYFVTTEKDEMYFVNELDIGAALKPGDLIEYQKNDIKQDIYISKINNIPVEEYLE